MREVETRSREVEELCSLPPPPDLIRKGMGEEKESWAELRYKWRTLATEGRLCVDGLVYRRAAEDARRTSQAEDTLARLDVARRQVRALSDKMVRREREHERELVGLAGEAADLRRELAAARMSSRMASHRFGVGGVSGGASPSSRPAAPMIKPEASRPSAPAPRSSSQEVPTEAPQPEPPTEPPTEPPIEPPPMRYVPPFFWRDETE